VASTNLECDTGKTEDSLCNWVQLESVNFFWFPYGRVHIGGPTSAKTVPYLITLSITLSVDVSIIGEYPSNNPSSSLIDERRDSAYESIITGCDGELQRDIQLHLLRIVILEKNYPVQ
jgi:hypothetical protein